MPRASRPAGPPEDPLALRGDAPLLDAYLRALDDHRQPFTIPGHKRRTDLTGAVVAGDVPLHGGLDTVRLETGVLADAERRAAELWGADWCRFSVGGATHGNQVLALAAARPGDQVVVSRTLHRSLLSGLVLAGLEPIWVRPWIDPATGLPGGVPADSVDRALAAHPAARAVFVGDPSYVGGVGDVAGLAEAAHAHDVPLIVDAAWAAHFGFHPDLPPHALACGADAMVTSAHKVLPAVSQAALVLARTGGGRLDPDRLDRSFDALHTTSPAGSILASIDAARALLESHGGDLLGEVIRLVAHARRRLRDVPGLDVLDGPWVDPAKLVVLVAAGAATGFDIEQHLLRHGHPVELADRRMLVPMITMADDASTVDTLVDRVSEAATPRSTAEPGSAMLAALADTERAVEAAVWSVEPATVADPRAAFFAPHVTVSAAEAIGRVSAELVAPYPPGIPVLAPGELITADAVALLEALRNEGARIAYAADPTLGTLQVVRDAP